MPVPDQATGCRPWEGPNPPIFFSHSWNSAPPPPLYVVGVGCKIKGEKKENPVGFSLAPLL
jgi:hypothetical protein